MNIKEMKEMIQIMNENNLTELELEKDGLKIRLKKGFSGSAEPVVAIESTASMIQKEAIIKEAMEAKESAKLSAAAAKNVIKSPMVGTFYAAPAPDAAPFVQIGMSIDVGQVVCIVEAMKLMNEIKAEIRGKVKEILVNNGDPVEFGQPLFVVE
jgi:oxaloacetate decarboxylase alpha subunit